MHVRLLPEGSRLKDCALLKTIRDSGSARRGYFYFAIRTGNPKGLAVGTGLKITEKLKH